MCSVMFERMSVSSLILFERAYPRLEARGLYRLSEEREKREKKRRKKEEKNILFR